MTENVSGPAPRRRLLFWLLVLGVVCAGSCAGVAACVTGGRNVIAWYHDAVAASEVDACRANLARIVTVA